MMTELTAEQEQTLKKYSENMNSIPTLTHKMNRKVITRELKIFFDFLGKSFPKHVVITRSPIEAQLVANYLNRENFLISLSYFMNVIILVMVHSITLDIFVS